MELTSREYVRLASAALGDAQDIMAHDPSAVELARSYIARADEHLAEAAEAQRKARRAENAIYEELNAEYEKESGK